MRALLNSAKQSQTNPISLLGKWGDKNRDLFVECGPLDFFGSALGDAGQDGADFFEGDVFVATQSDDARDGTVGQSAVNPGTDHRSQ